MAVAAELAVKAANVPSTRRKTSWYGNDTEKTFDNVLELSIVCYGA